jgi:hypothetical protein
MRGTVLMYVVSSTAGAAATHSNSAYTVRPGVQMQPLTLPPMIASYAEYVTK